MDCPNNAGLTEGGWGSLVFKWTLRNKSSHLGFNFSHASQHIFDMLFSVILSLSFLYVYNISRWVSNTHIHTHTHAHTHRGRERGGRSTYVSIDKSYADCLFKKKKSQPDCTAGKKCLCFTGSIKLFITPAGMGKSLAGHQGAQEECWASVWHVGEAFQNHLQPSSLPEFLRMSWRLPFSCFLLALSHPSPAYLPVVLFLRGRYSKMSLSFCW